MSARRETDGPEGDEWAKWVQSALPKLLREVDTKDLTEVERLKLKSGDLIGFHKTQRSQHGVSVHGRYSDGTPWPSLTKHLEQKQREHPCWPENSIPVNQVRLLPLHEVQAESWMITHPGQFMTRLRLTPEMATVLAISLAMDNQERKARGLPVHSFPEITHIDDIQPQQLADRDWNLKHPLLQDNLGRLFVYQNHPMVRQASRRLAKMTQTEREELLPFASRVGEDWRLNKKLNVPKWLNRRQNPLIDNPPPSPLLTMSIAQLRERVTKDDLHPPPIPSHVDSHLYQEVRKELYHLPHWGGRPFRFPYRPAGVLDFKQGFMVRSPEPLDLLDPRGLSRVQYFPPKPSMPKDVIRESDMNSELGAELAELKHWDEDPRLHKAMARKYGYFPITFAPQLPLRGDFSWPSVEWLEDWEHQHQRSWSDPFPANYPEDAPESTARDYPPPILGAVLPGDPEWPVPAGVSLPPDLQHFVNSRRVLMSHDWTQAPPFEPRPPAWYEEYYGAAQTAGLVAVGVGVSLLGWRFARARFPWLRRKQKTTRRNFLPGGFESPMTKREAALILGCRQGANREQILARYRTLMRLNHPDLGGSPFVSTKINEAKDILFKSARGGTSA